MTATGVRDDRRLGCVQSVPSISEDVTARPQPITNVGAEVGRRLIESRERQNHV